jgi:hypothetical protein
MTPRRNTRLSVVGEPARPEPDRDVAEQLGRTCAGSGMMCRTGARGEARGVTCPATGRTSEGPEACAPRLLLPEHDASARPRKFTK